MKESDAKIQTTDRLRKGIEGCLAPNQSGRQLKPDVMTCFDLELPEDFVPHAQDGEVHAFELWPVDRVYETVRDTNQFKYNCNLVLIDFFVRHGLLRPDDTDYFAIVEGLRQTQPAGS